MRMINEMPSPVLVTGQMNFIFRARMLWRDLATWMTIYMVSALGGYPNQAALTARLYELPLEYGNFLRLVYGQIPAEEYINLLSVYIINFLNLFHAQMSGDAAAAEIYARQMIQNLNQRAAFLSRINPYWQSGAWRSLLYNFHNLMLEDAQTLLTNDFERNVGVFDRIMAFSSVIGDYFSEGILNYLAFPGTVVPVQSERMRESK